MTQARDLADGKFDTSTLVVDAANNRVGIGTTSMSNTLQVQGNGARFVNSADTDALHLFGYNGSNHADMSLYTASGNNTVKISTSEASFFDGGFVGIGYTASASDWSAAMKVHIQGSKGLTVKSTGGSSEEAMAVWNTGTSGTRYQIYFADGAGSARGSITTNGSSTSYNTTSDYRLKENVADMTGAITRVKQLAPKRFNFIDDPDDTIVDGFLAHEAQTVVPEAVVGTHNEVDDDGNAVMQSIDQAKLVPLLTAALKESITKIEALEARVTALEDA